MFTKFNTTASTTLHFQRWIMTSLYATYAQIKSQTICFAFVHKFQVFFGFEFFVWMHLSVCSLYKCRMCSKINANNYARCIYTLVGSRFGVVCRQIYGISSFSHFSRSSNLTLSFALVNGVIPISSGKFAQQANEFCFLPSKWQWNKNNYAKRQFDHHFRFWREIHCSPNDAHRRDVPFSFVRPAVVCFNYLFWKLVRQNFIIRI